MFQFILPTFYLVLPCHVKGEAASVSLRPQETLDCSRVLCTGCALHPAYISRRSTGSLLGQWGPLGAGRPSLGLPSLSCSVEASRVKYRRLSSTWKGGVEI